MHVHYHARIKLHNSYQNVYSERELIYKYIRSSIVTSLCVGEGKSR